jgi:hypothetical protein
LWPFAFNHRIEEPMDSHADKYPICRHIKTNGCRCQSPAITGSGLCYFHRTIRRTHDAVCTSKIGPLRPETVQYLLENGQRPAQFAASPACNFPPLEDPEAIQLSISLLFAAIAAGQVDPGLARTLLYALQVASWNVRALAPAPATGEDFTTLARRVVRTRDGHSLAARGDGNGIPSQASRPKSLLQRMIEEFGPPTPLPPDPATPTE